MFFHIFSCIFRYFHVFSYSERDNTAAENISPKIRSEKIMERSQILHSLSKKKKNEFYQQNVGRVREVLIESCEEGYLSGLTENYIRVQTVGNPEEVNTIIPLQLRHIQGDKMTGQRIG